ncbi:MAG TPA: hypothetical protein VM531_12155 [Sphingomicrobium sp.]|jgi:hypothetical protein|nr:hypothetical protein [Sphingomicrobium sp.]
MAHFMQAVLEAVVTMLSGNPKWLEQEPKWAQLLWAVLMPFAVLAALLAVIIIAGNAVRGAS